MAVEREVFPVADVDGCVAVKSSTEEVDEENVSVRVTEAG